MVWGIILKKTQDMFSFHFYLPCVFTIVSLMATTSCTIVEESLVTTRKNLFLKGHVIQRQPTTNQLSCAHHCIRKKGCVSFNFKLSSHTKGLCELSSGTAGPIDRGLTGGAGWIYGQIVYSGKKSVEQRDKSDISIHVTFTSLGVKGREGPTDTSGYKGSPLEGKVQLVAGIQIWSVPVTGLYSVTAWGASGGNGTKNNGRAGWTLGGKGARIKGNFKLTAGEKLKILVGQEGQVQVGGFSLVVPGGGGGGTFVTKVDDTPLVIAGGGGGGAGLESVNSSNGDHGQTSENGTRHGGFGGLGGSLYPSSKIEGSGGGGYRGAGQPSGTCTGGQSFLYGGSGGESRPGVSDGGFGGGGAGTSYPGGGGGYSGGGIEAGNGAFAGGGGSYNGGTMQENTEGVQHRDGKVVIKFIK